VFTDNMVYVAQDGTEMVRCTRADGIGLKRLQATGVQTLIISTEANPVVSARASKLKIVCHQDCEDKRALLDDILVKMGAVREDAAFVGNDVNDASVLEVVGLPVVVRDAHPDVVPLAQYQTRAAGGHGAVREICDFFASVRERNQATSL
jgi:3-deoxy-D-manno-octulosonate 8-phosphate phosphatase (KDO 8-P phosphatase)